MISRESSGSVVKDLGVQYGDPWFERWQLFFTFFMYFFLPMVTVLLGYPMIYSCLVFAL